MSVLARIARAIIPRLSQPRRNFSYFIAPQVANIPVTEETSLALSTVWACTTLTADTLASLPWQTMQDDGATRTRIREHPADAIVRVMPNSDMCPADWIGAMVICEELWGNAYSVVERRRRDSAPLSVIPVYPPRVESKRDDDGLRYYIVSDDMGNTYRVEQGDMFHFKGPSIDGLTGLETIRFATKSVGLGLATEQFGINLFSQGCRPSGTLEVPQALSDEAYERLRSDFQAQYGGLQSSAKFVLLEGGTTFKPLATTAEDSQFLETRKLQVREICRRLRTPPHKIGDLEDAHFTNIEHQEIDWVRTKITPLCVRFEQEFARKLLSESDRAAGMYGKFNIKGLLRGDSAARSAFYKVLREIGAMSANEIRRLEDDDPISPKDGGDDYWRPANFVVAGAPLPVLPSPAMASPQKPGQTEAVFAELAQEALHRCLRKESKALERVWDIGLTDAFYAQLAVEIGDSLLPILSGLNELRGDGRSAAQLADVTRALGRFHVDASRRLKKIAKAYSEWHAAAVEAVDAEVEAAIAPKRELAIGT